MFRRWKTLSFGAACTASLTSSLAAWAECPCNRANVFQISQVAPMPAPPLTPPVPSPLTAPAPHVTTAPGLPAAPPPGISAGTHSAPATPVPHDAHTSSPPPGTNLTPTPIVGEYAPGPAASSAADRPEHNRFGMSPPPGTLGRTYQQRSRIFDDEKHPRMAAVDVYLPEDLDVSGRGMKSVWTGKHWRLEAKEPLLPGVPHIYAIKAERKNPEGEVISTDVRWIRLIPGRVVDLRF